MSGGSHFFKHLSGSLNRSLIHRHSRLLQLPSITTIGLQSPVPLWKPLSSFSPNISTTTTSSSSFSSVSATSSSASTTNLTSSASAYRSYVSVRIRCPQHAYESFSDALLEFGASSTTVNDEENYQGASEVSDGFNEVVVDSIFLERQDVKGCILKAANAAGLNRTPSYDVKMGERDDWVQKSLEFFDPVEVTKGLWIVPEWKSPPDIHATNIILNPGVAFGTGEHSTTKLCLLLLKSLIKGGECFLDYGTGSGVLGIAALKFGAATSVGIDVDEQAITSARNNAALNNIGPETMKLHLVSGRIDSRTDGVVSAQGSNVTGVFPETETCDVVIANILLNPLLELADNIVSFAKPGAIVAVSGILSEQVPQIIDRYSQLLEDLQVTEMDGWACVSGRKEAKSQRS